MAFLPSHHADKIPLQDHCGIVGIFSAQDAPLFSHAYHALLTLQTRGYDGAGFWAIDSAGREFQHKGQGKIRAVLGGLLDTYKSTPFRMIIMQTRYGTSGEQSLENVQPLRLEHFKNKEVFSLAHNGQFSTKPGDELSGLSDTVLFAKKLSTKPQLSWDARISSALLRQKGAYSLLIANAKTLYACRDTLGIRPLVYGRISLSKPYQWIVASETSSIETIGANHVKEVLPGEIIAFTESGVRKVKKPVTNTQKALCIFENVYLMDEISKAHLPTKHPKELRNSPNINQVHFRSGQILAKEAPLTRKEVDMVIGVPGTGISGGQGFANVLRLPYIQAISDKDTPDTEERTFMTGDIDLISKKVLAHFDIAKDVVRGKRLCLVDDSLVRGNITTNLIQLLKKQYGAKAIHVRILCPPIDKPCYLGINTRNPDELIVHNYRGDLEKVRKHIGAASLVYISAEGLKEAITNNPQAKGFCMGCMLGHIPPLTKDGKKQ